jgi:hypothetical protein
MIIESGGDFCENRYSESHSLLKGVNEALPSISTSFFRVWQYSVQEMATNNYRVVAIFVKTVALKAILSFRGVDELLPACTVYIYVCNKTQQNPHIFR